MKLKSITILAATILLLGCGQKSDDSSQSGSPKPVAAKDSQLELLEKASAKYIKTFAGELKGELMAAMSEGGMTSAISICQNAAPRLAEEMSVNNWSIKRVSDKNRNIHNAADEHQLEILKRFSDSLSIPYIDEYITVDSNTSYYYYQPITTSPLCLKCHGANDQIDSKVKMTIRDKYPNDLAIDYKSGELRGMFVVEAKFPGALEYARELAKDSL